MGETDQTPLKSVKYQLALSAGVALAASIQSHDDPGSSHTCDEILNSIDPTRLKPQANTLFEFLNTETAVTLDVSSTGQPTEEMTIDTLEPQSFAHFLERLDN